MYLLYGKGKGKRTPKCISLLYREGNGDRDDSGKYCGGSDDSGYNSYESDNSDGVQKSDERDNSDERWVQTLQFCSGALRQLCMTTSSPRDTAAMTIPWRTVTDGGGAYV
jgi:hypothetical protein